MNALTDIVSRLRPITLEQMSGVKLMNRTDTKFVTTEPMLLRLLELAGDSYRVQDIAGERMASYHTLYYDTRAMEMYLMHLHGHTGRQKIRVRSYLGSNLSFLEVKTKNNHGRTKKKRVALDFNDVTAAISGVNSWMELAQSQRQWVDNHLRYGTNAIVPRLENNFERLTLVNDAMSERLTIDRQLRFHNRDTGRDIDLTGLVIIELKRDGLQPSPVTAMLRRLRIMPHGFSKYCMGTAMTNPDVPRGRFKERLHSINRILSGIPATQSGQAKARTYK